MQERKVAAFSFLAQVSRVITGPITLLVISSQLLPEEMAFYYSFFNVIAMQQLIEIGIGLTLKQFIAHSYTGEKGRGGEMGAGSYHLLSRAWFYGIALFNLLIIYPFGLYFFSSYSGGIEWQLPWLFVVVSNALMIVQTPRLILLESCQYQVDVYRIKLITSLISSILFCISLMSGLGLYSVGISVLSICIIQFFLTSKRYKYITLMLDFDKPTKQIKLAFSSIWPMLSKVSVTWFSGFFFWNSFNLIAFKMMPIETAGKFGFTLAIAKAGYAIAQSITSSQTTIYAKMISKGESLGSYLMFKKYKNISLITLFFGYFLYFLLSYFYIDFFVFERVLSETITLGIFLYFLLLLPLVLDANYCRSYKVEPYMILSLFCNFMVPVIFFLVVYYKREINFYYFVPLSLFLLLWSNLIVKETRIKFQSPKEN